LSLARFVLSLVSALFEFYTAARHVANSLFATNHWSVINFEHRAMSAARIAKGIPKKISCHVKEEKPATPTECSKICLMLWKGYVIVWVSAIFCDLRAFFKLAVQNTACVI
jgi:hypothetical protein